MMVNVAILVSGGGTNLQAIIDADKRGEIKNGRLSLVLSSTPGVYALERAKAAGIESAVLDIKKHSDREEYSELVSKTLKEHNIGLVVFAGFMYILSPSFCKEYENRILNVHPALIPSFCGVGFYGLRVHRAVLEAGVKLTGATVHFVNEITDGGPIILQKAVDIHEDETPESLQQRVMKEAEWDILPRAVSLFCEGRLSVKGHIVRISNSVTQ